MENFLNNIECFAIYGAQVVAYGAYKAIEHLYGRKPECFIVTNTDNNPRQIDGLDVKSVDCLQPQWGVIIAVTELLQDEIMSELSARGYVSNKIFRLTQHEEFLLMSKYYSSIGKFSISFGSSDEKNIDFMLYEVKNHRDKPLKAAPKLSSYETSIQAGAALTNKRIASVTDDVGENISSKNKQYCEMTAVYWLWKNVKHNWIGIEHYRRHLLVLPSMLTDNVDVILPLPYMCAPSTAAQFARFVSQDVTKALLKALKDIYPSNFDNYCDIFYGKYQYTYNMLCAKYDVFCEYCKWFFAITEYMESMEKDVPEIKSTRALSYVAEVLTNIFFMSNEDKYNILHTEKIIYV